MIGLLALAAVAGAAVAGASAWYAGHGHVCARCGRPSQVHYAFVCRLDEDRLLCPDCEDWGGGDWPTEPPDDPGGRMVEIPRDDLAAPALITGGTRAMFGTRVVGAR